MKPMFVVHHKTELPLFIHYCPGNPSDAFTLIKIILEKYLDLFDKYNISVIFKDAIIPLPSLVFPSNNQKYAILLEEEALICR